MFNCICVGDMHVQIDSLEDCQSLVDLAKSKAKEKSCSNIFFLGDLFHTHQIIRSEVLSFWKHNFDSLIKEDFTVFVLLGNHDKSAAGQDVGPHALEVFKNFNPNLHILDEITELDRNIYAIPHYYNSNNFLNDMNNIEEPSTIFTHTTFNGSVYDNGFYAPDGLDVSKEPHYFISGHLHTQHELSNVLYTGAPRWLNASDVNKPKSIWYFEINGRNIVIKEAFDVSHYVTNFYEINETAETLEHSKTLSEINLNKKAKVIVNIKGTESFIKKRLDFYNELRKLSSVKFQIRTTIEKKKQIAVKESDGMTIAFLKYFNSFNPRFGSDKTKLLKIIEERASWLIK